MDQNKLNFSKKVIDQFRQEGFASRAADIDTNVIDEENRTARAVLLTESAVTTIDWAELELVREIVVIDEQTVELPENRKVPLVDSHMRHSTEWLRGSIRDLKVENNEVVGRAYFSSLAEDSWTLVKEQHLTDISAGFRVYSDFTIKLAPGEKTEVRGRQFENNYGDSMNLIIRTKATPKEGSLVIIGADTKSKMRNGEDYEILNQQLEKIRTEIKTDFENFKTETENRIKSIKMEDNTMSETKEKQEQLSPEKIREQEVSRISEIEAFTKRFSGKVENLDETREKAVKENWSVGKFQDHILRNLDTSKDVETPTEHLGMSKKEVKEYSLTRAIQSKIVGNKEAAPFEMEVSKEVADKMGRNPKDERSFFVPYDVLMNRTLTIGTDAQAGYLKGTEHLGGSFIELLRDRLALSSAGVTMLTGLQGDIQIPKQTSAATFGWTAEETANSQSFLNVGQVTGSPKEGSATTEYSRKLLLQSDPSIEQLVLNDLNSIAARGIDTAGLHGTGNSNEPTGVANANGVNSIDASTFNWNTIVDFETQIELDNANMNSLNWIANPKVKGKAKTTVKESGEATYLMTEGGEMNGYPSIITNLANDGYLFFGDWSQLLMLLWGSTEVLVNPYGTNSRAGNVEISIFVAVDFIVRHTGAFSVASNVSV